MDQANIKDNPGVWTCQNFPNFFRFIALFPPLLCNSLHHLWVDHFPKGLNIEKNKSRLNNSILLEIFEISIEDVNLDLQNSPQEQA